jgi:hypothetical protein
LVVRVRPLSTAAIERVASTFLQEVGGTADAPTIADWRSFVDHELPKLGVIFYPASPSELSGNHAHTDAKDDDGSGAINVLMQSNLYEALGDDTPDGAFARSTAAHELGHVVLHVPAIRRARIYSTASQVLPRVQSKDVRAFESSEWQAYAFGGFFLMPRASVKRMVDEHWSTREIARAYGVNPAFVNTHMKRLRMKF